MSAPLIRSGYDVSILVRVRVNGVNEDLSTATIKASLVNADKSAELITDTAQSSSATGASWAAGLIAVEFTAAQTASLTAAAANLEIAITTSGGKRVPCESVPVRVEKGWTIT